jgi:predicted O-linked N-acetylglucosamine transferase (SPINDLY family)
MNEFGITADRLSFVSTKTEHLKYYNEIDIAFDTFPHTGGTTTCEALWMGVPVVSLVGPMFFERISYSNLSNCGLSDLCAFNLQQYQDIAISLALDKERRKYLRLNLRKQILNSPLGRPQEFATDFTTTLLHAWSK